jgi:sterol desaturase/sphingolipid hydroxylase (fatty acid hydroxylase superfamily)
MAKLSQKIKVSLDEARMLVLGTQVLTSLQFELAFQSAFTSSPVRSQRLVVVGLALLLIALFLLLWGPAYHRIVWDGKCTRETHQFMTRTLCAALLPVGTVLSADAFIAVDKLLGARVGVVAAGVTALECLLFWFVLSERAKRSQSPEVRRMKEESKQQKAEQPELHERVSQVLTEARVVLPGAQAMLGFAFITMFTREFEQMPHSSQLIHLACVGLIALTVVLLMTPAAFHRIAESGEDSERLVRVASRLVVGALVPLALGIVGDFYVVTRKITGSLPLAATGAAVLLVICMGMWFGYTWFRRWQLGSRSDRPIGQLAHSNQTASA